MTNKVRSVPVRSEVGFLENGKLFDVGTDLSSLPNISQHLALLHTFLVAVDL